MSHEILERFRIHPGFRHVGAIGVAAHMGWDVRHLNLVNFIVPLHRMVESMLPVHCHLRHTILIQVQESAVY